MSGVPKKKKLDYPMTKIAAENELPDAFQSPLTAPLIRVVFV